MVMVLDFCFGDVCTNTPYLVYIRFSWTHNSSTSDTTNCHALVPESPTIRGVPRHGFRRFVQTPSRNKIVDG